MKRRGSLPAVVRAALRAPGGRCYRHCDRPLRVRHPATSLPGQWSVQACPSGVVSVTSYAAWTNRETTRAVREELRRWTDPPSLVRSWDLRTATRHGPELGRAAERFLSRARPPRKVRVVYWRVYPFRANDGTARRLFVCFRRAHRQPVFFAADPESASPACPVCALRIASGTKARTGR